MTTGVSRIVGVAGVAAALWLAGCDNSPWPADGAFSAGTGMLRVLITDKPFPFEFIEEALVTITRVEVRRAEPSKESEPDETVSETEPTATEAGDDGENEEGEHAPTNDEPAGDDQEEESDDDSAFVEVFTGEKTFDLLDLRNGRTDLLADAELPAGSYDQMRLIVTAGRVTLTDGRQFDLRVPSGEQTGIKLHLSFDVVENGDTVLLLDVDLSRAFSAIPSGHIDDVTTIRRFRFHPSLAMRLIRLLEAGEISGTALDENQLPLAGVAVSAFDGDTELTSTASEADGTFALIGLPTGLYRVAFSAAGFQSLVIEDVEVAAEEVTDLGEVVLQAAAPQS